jgi:hypothetical protein
VESSEVTGKSRSAMNSGKSRYDTSADLIISWLAFDHNVLWIHCFPQWSFAVVLLLCFLTQLPKPDKLFCVSILPGSMETAHFNSSQPMRSYMPNFAVLVKLYFFELFS